MGGRFGHKRRVKKEVVMNGDRLKCADCDGLGRIDRNHIYIHCVACGGEGFVLREARPYRADISVTEIEMDEFAHIPIPPLPHRWRMMHWLYHDKAGKAHRGFRSLIKSENFTTTEYYRNENGEVTEIYFNHKTKERRGRLVRVVKNEFDMSDAAIREIEEAFPNTDKLTAAFR